ncbi:hypothetical protein OIU78_010327 [Salix suchowensis]|nr:hypothetical protein OIU78_010327 [Salix suchowensis]
MGQVLCFGWKWNAFAAIMRAKLKSRQGVPIVGFTEMGVVEPTRGKGVGRDGVSLGEVVFSSESVMLGYFNYPLGTPTCMKGGWFYTGDVGVVHSYGYLEMNNWSEHVIISGGENIRSVEDIGSVEIESVLYIHPAVSWTAVVPRSDEFWGESPCAFVSLKHGFSNEPGERDIIDYCREKMAHFMLPKNMVFKD